MKNKMISQMLFGIMLFIALIAVSFRFDQRSVYFLVDSPYQRLIWLAFLGGVLILLFLNQKISKNQLLILGGLYAFIPFSCYFYGGQGVNFVILQNHMEIAWGLWAIASIALSIGLMKKELFPEKS